MTVEPPVSLSKIYLPLAAALAMWFVLFSPLTKGLVNFWLGMTVAAGVLAGVGLSINGNHNRAVFKFELHHVLVGILSTILLYLIYLTGNTIASWLFEFAKPQVAQIYATRTQAPVWLIGCLLFIWIGPAEEIFWRGFIQRKLSIRFSNPMGFVLATVAYAFVHIWSLNLMLILAAGFCGIFWGALYWRYQSIWPGLISHALWDVAVFVLWPIK